MHQATAMFNNCVNHLTGNSHAIHYRQSQSIGLCRIKMCSMWFFHDSKRFTTGLGEYTVHAYPFEKFRIFRWIANSHKFISIFRIVRVLTYSQICQAFVLFSIWFKYEIGTNLLKYSIYGNDCEGNFYLSKYSKYDEKLPKDMWWLYIHRGLPCLFTHNTSIAQQELQYIKTLYMAIYM
jgi:hypothetical protein